MALLEDQAQQSVREALRPQDATGETSVADLARRGLAAFGEAGGSLGKTTAQWRFGRGPFAPLQLLTGGRAEVLHHGVALLRRFFERHPRFAFIAHPGSELVMETIGGGLRSREFALVKTDRDRVTQIVDGMNFRGGERRIAEDFANDIAPRVTCGVYRVTRHAGRRCSGRTRTTRSTPRLR